MNLKFHKKGNYKRKKGPSVIRDCIVRTRYLSAYNLYYINSEYSWKELMINFL